jgi:tetratricopeptide (TPR) repeat protein
MKPLLFFFLCIVSSLSFADEDLQTLSQEAYSLYQKGEQAQTISERNIAFNQALKYYSKIEAVAPSGELFYNIANAYFQLQEYEKALLYYARAKALLPREQKIAVNLEITLSKISNPESWQSQYWIKLFTLTYLFSNKEIGYLFLTIIILCFASSSLLIWFKKSIWRTTSLLLGLIFIYIFSLFVSRTYLLKEEAIAMQNVMIYRDAGTHYGPVSDSPLSSGVLLQVLDEEKNGWIKVRLNNEVWGYVPQKNLEII